MERIPARRKDVSERTDMTAHKKRSDIRADKNQVLFQDRKSDSNRKVHGPAFMNAYCLLTITRQGWNFLLRLKVNQSMGERQMVL